MGLSIFVNAQYRELLKQREMKSWGRQLKADLPSSHLRSVLSGYGYSTAAEQMGIMTLMAVRKIKEPEEGFKCTSVANTWFKETTQNKFLREGERWSPENQIIEKDLLQESQRVNKSAELLGLTTRKIPAPSVLSKKHISILPGALETRFSQRIDSLAEEIRASGKPPSAVIAATGYRKLINSECSKIRLTFRTEEEMIRHQWKEAIKRHPNLANVPFHVSTAKLKAGQSRSTTEDTVEALMNHEVVKRADCAIVHIENPFGSRFLGIFKRLPTMVYVYANEKDEETPLFLLTDEIARKVFSDYLALQERYKKEDETDVGDQISYNDIF